MIRPAALGLAAMLLGSVVAYPALAAPISASQTTADHETPPVAPEPYQAAALRAQTELAGARDDQQSMVRAVQAGDRAAAAQILERHGFTSDQLRQATLELHNELGAQKSISDARVIIIVIHTGGTTIVIVIRR